MAQSCLHIVINFLWLPEPEQNIPYLSPYHQTVQNSAKLCENVKILQKRTNSAAWLKILCSAENCCPQ